MRRFFAVAMGSLVALVGFASTANASTTIDLIWIDVTATATNGSVICIKPAKRNCGPDLRSPDSGVTVSGLDATDSITLAVVLTAGPAGSNGGGVSVTYSDAIPVLGVTGFQAMTTTIPVYYLPGAAGATTDTGTTIDNINALADQNLTIGFGLPAGGTAYLGTVTFHHDQLINGTHEVSVGVDGPTDGLLLGDASPDFNATFNSAFVVNVPEPGALSLLVMGLGGMLLAGRGRRS
jgi:hypothetical protein